MTAVKWYLFDPESSEKVNLEEHDEFMIGRGRSNDLSIADKSVSTRHAKIVKKEEKFFIVDLKSFNATLINGSELRPDWEMRLKTGDVVQVGDKVFYFSSTEPNQALLDLPSMTDTFKLNAHKTQDVIVRNYEEPIIDLENQKKPTSLKSLRSQKEEIEKLYAQLSSTKGDCTKREEHKKTAEVKAKELEEFNVYLKAKKYDSEESVNATISSIIHVCERLDVDKKKVDKKISVLENEINKLRTEVAGLSKEKATNMAIIDELKNDIEIIKGRDSLEEELSQMYRQIRQWNKEDLTQKVTMIKALIDEKEKEFKKVQKDYADSRFGNKDIFGRKKVS